MNPRTTYKEPKALYHCTSMDVLLAILTNLKSRTELLDSDYPFTPSCPDENYFRLYATHAYYFNDPEEYSYWIKLMKTGMEKYENERKISDNRKSEHIDMLFKRVDRYRNFMDFPYLTSLSTEKDSLSLWRPYGDDGRGVAMGLDLKKLREYIGCTRYPMEITDCLYDSGAEYCTKKFYDSFLKADKKTGKFHSPENFNLYHHCKRYQSKQIAYKDECEWRLVITHGTISETKYRVSNGVITPYKEIWIPVSCLHEIVLGPACPRPDLASRSIDALLNNDKYQFVKEMVKESTISYIPQKG